MKRAGKRAVVRRLGLTVACLMAVLVAGPMAGPASACPMCKYANEADQASEAENLRPRAYMYSILFMLSMPATLLTGFSLGFYRLWRKQQELNRLLIEDRATTPE
jgi:hypothetical protein